MNDAPALLHAYLSSNAALTALIGNRLWAEEDTPPATLYKPSNGPAIAFKARGGQTDTTDTLLYTSWQFKVYGFDSEANNNARRRTYLALMDALHDPQGRGGISGSIEVAGQTLSEPRTEWEYILLFAQTWMYSGLPTYTPN